MSALGPGCVKTRQVGASAQQSNPHGRELIMMLPRMRAPRINLAPLEFEISFYTAWVINGHSVTTLQMSAFGGKADIPDHPTGPTCTNRGRPRFFPVTAL